MRQSTSASEKEEIMLVPAVYECCLWVYALYALPKMFWQRTFKGKYKDSFSKRLGKNFPQIEKGTRQLIWIHAVSVGETKAVAELAKRIKESDSNPILVISSISETGHAEAKKSLPFADYHVYLPFDLRPIITPIVQRVRPDLVILTETDYWFNFLKCAKSFGAHLFVVNAKLSQRSQERLEYFPFYTKPLFAFFEAFAVQSRHYLTRFEKLGIPAEKLKLTGNLKFDARFPKQSPQEIATWRETLGIKQGDFVLVIGSTHSPEEEQLLKVLKPLFKEMSNFRVILVPRHTDRTEEVVNIINTAGFTQKRLSQLPTAAEDTQVILIDRMGVLLKCYEIADLAIVAGSYTERIGGHNLFEPSAYGVPVLFGPYMHSQPEMVELVKEYDAGLQVSLGELEEKVRSLIALPQERHRLGQNGLTMLNSVQGALERTWQVIRPWVK